MSTAFAPSAISAEEVAARANPFIVADGTLEAIKWLALVAMTADHLNKFFFAEQLPGVFAVGRIVMPTFGFILGYNLARPGALKRGVHRRLLKRLGFVGLLATPAVIALNHSVVSHNAWWPINILITLWLVVALTALIERGGLWRCTLAIFLFLVAGAVIEYLWFGVLACLGAWAYCKERSAPRLMAWFLGVLSLSVINGNAWALLSLPLMAVASKLTIDMPRSKWFFYLFYPAHLWALWLIKLALA